MFQIGKMDFFSKSKTFLLGDYTRWEIPTIKIQDFDKTELIKNKIIAFDLMFPKVMLIYINLNNLIQETLHVEELKETFAYFDRQTFIELQRNFEWKNKSYANNFITFSKEQAENLMAVKPPL